MVFYLQRCGTCSYAVFFFSYFTAVWYVLDTYETCDSKREDKIMETLFEKVMELDSLMEEGYRGARANINLLQ